MKKVVRKSFKKNKENIYLKSENNFVEAKIIYSPIDPANFLYELIITNKETKTEEKHQLGCFNIVKAKYAFGEIVIGKNTIKIIPVKKQTTVYNLHEKDIKEYIFTYQSFS